MKIIVINGPNLDMLGIREKELYGNNDYKSLVKFCKEQGKKRGIKIECFQSNCEGKIIDKIHSCYGKKDGIIINAGGYVCGIGEWRPERDGQYGMFHVAGN